MYERNLKEVLRMKKNLKRIDNKYWNKGEGVSGDLTGISGNLSGVTGDLSGIMGNLSGIIGDLTGIRGDLTGVSGDLYTCELTAEDRKRGVRVEDLVK
jgi:hypothetical protein